MRLGVVNLSGNLYLRAGRSAFTEIEVALGELGEVDHVLVDMHAEATSEKIAMGWHLDGRVTAVVGTHTHVPTADARVLPGGTAYITDVGMTGPRGGVIGVKREQAIESLLTQMPVRFETSEEDPWLMGVLIRCSRPLRADSIEQVLMPRPPAASRIAEAPQQGEHREREEPGYVQVEPVVDPQLGRDDHRRARRRQADEVRAAGNDRERQRERDRRDLDEPLQAAEPAVQPPHRERRPAVGLIGDRALIDRVQRVVAERPGSDASAAVPRNAARKRARRARAPRGRAARAARASPAAARARAGRTWSGPPARRSTPRPERATVER